MSTNTEDKANRLRELSQDPIGRLLWKYSLPAVVGTVVMSLYHVIDSIVIGHAIDDPNVVAGIAVTFPVMNLSGALGMLIGAGATARISIVLGEGNKPRAELILGNALVLSLLIGITYVTLFSIFLTPILRAFGASDASLPYAHEFMAWVLPGLMLTNLTFSFNNVMRATGYPRKAMETNLIGAGLNVLLAPLFLFGFGWGVRGAAIATDISMAVTAYFVLRHFCVPGKNLGFTRGTYRLKWQVFKNITYIGMAPFIINVAAAGINAIINNSLMAYGGDNAIAAVVVFNRFSTIFIMIVIGICQGMQPLLGYNYGAGIAPRLFRTLKYAIMAGSVVTVTGSVLGQLFAHSIAAMFMQDEEQIRCAVGCLHITTLGFWMVGFQVVSTNFFQSLGMAGKAVFLSLTRQVLFMIPLLFLLPPLWKLDGVWAAFPISDTVATVVTAAMLSYQITRLRRRFAPAS